MVENSFLGKLAATLLADYPVLNDVTVVLPSRRARVFLLQELQRRTPGNTFAPRIMSVEDLIAEMAGLRPSDPIETLFEFYEVYTSRTPPEHLQPFEQFANWGKVILQDFNEIDRYLKSPREILSYLVDIERIKHWSPDNGRPSDLVGKYLNFWSQLPEYYDSLYQRMKNRGTAYQGMMYREAIANLGEFCAAHPSTPFVFAGLNALNEAEEQIVKHMLERGHAKVYWDADEAFMSDDIQDAGLFLRRFRHHWRYFDSHPFEWVTAHFSEEKDIHIIGTPKSIGQAKIAGEKIESIIRENGSGYLSQTALILGEENLLLPVLHALPAEVGTLNITMGYPAKHNPAQILVSKLFRLHLNALSRKSASYVMYYKDLLEVLTHPLVQPHIDGDELARIIRHDNYSFISHDRVVEIAGANTPLFHHVIRRWTGNPAEALQQLIEVLLGVKESLNKGDDDKVAKAFLYAIFKVINKLKSFFLRYENVANLETLYAMYKQVVDLAEVSFEGEPLQGLQIMGVLESRAVDFDTVIITSMNEGRFPAGKSNVSFIPYDVKREFNLPTYKEKDAIYTYHFYRVLQRAKRVILLYNTDNEGLDGGEKSRFLTQLEVERQPMHRIRHDIYNPVVPKVAHEPAEIPKSGKVVERLRMIASDGLYPTNITTYIRNPLLFYYRKILQIREVDDVEESIALNTLGTIIHETLKALYEPFIGRLLRTADIENMVKRADDEVMRQFREVYKMGEIRKGKNLLAFEVAKRNVQNFLKMELKDLKEGADIEIVALEQNFVRRFEHPRLPFPILLKGNVDRIERRNGVLRIIDYKTGKVEDADMKLKEWGALMTDIKFEKLVQVLAYAFICRGTFATDAMEVGIISFKNLKCGFMPFNIPQGKEKDTSVTDEMLAQYLEELAALLAEIFDADKPFVEKII